MQPAKLTTFQYLSSIDYVEAVSYAAKQALDAHEKWYVFLQSNVYVCCNQENVHPFTGVPCVAEIHGQNIPIEEKVNEDVQG